MRPHPRVRDVRRQTRKSAPFHLKHCRSFKNIETVNGKVGEADGYFSYEQVDKEKHIIAIATKQCCVRYVVEVTLEEVLHASGWLEKEVWPEGKHKESPVLRELMKRGTHSREVAFGLLATIWRIPMYCKDHEPKE